MTFQPIGTVDVVGRGAMAALNVGEGDLKLSFDPTNPGERARAAAIVTEMLGRGYAILVQVGEEDGEPVYRRVKTFDPKRCEYTVVGTPDEAMAVQAAVRELAGAVDEPVGAAPAKRRGGTRGRGKSEYAIPAASTRAVSVARSAGG